MSFPGQEQANISIAEANSISDPSAIPSSELEPGGVPSGAHSSDKVPQVSPPSSEPKEKKNLQDLATGFADEKPLQNAKYSSDSALLQGAALRRRTHPRRTIVSLGTCSVGLSGPPKPTPRPVAQVHENHVFLLCSRCQARPDGTNSGDGSAILGGCADF